MSGFLAEAERDFEGGENNNSQQSSGNDGNQQTQNSSNDNNSSGGGMMSNLERGGEDTMINQEVNNFANKEGVPAGFDGAIDNAVDGEANKIF